MRLPRTRPRTLQNSVMMMLYAAGDKNQIHEIILPVRRIRVNQSHCLTLNQTKGEGKSHVKI
jgi:hypothetical protein